MSAPDRANDARRVVKIFKKPEWVHSDGGRIAWAGDYLLSDRSVLSSGDDEAAQINFKNAGYNKGKAKDMVKNLASNTEKSIPTSSTASKNYEP